MTPRITRTLATSALSILFVVLAMPTRAAACTCFLVGPVCQGYWAFDAVFEGVVTSVERLSHEQAARLDARLVRVAAASAWKGTGSRTIEVLTGHGGGDCGYPFEVGARYVVYALKRSQDGRLTTSICTLTKKYSDASEDLAFFEGLARPATGGRIFGDILYRDPARPAEVRGLAGVLVVLAGRLVSRETRTDSMGRFSFEGLAVGHYTVAASIPDGLEPTHPQSVEIPDPRACAEALFRIM